MRSMRPFMIPLTIATCCVALLGCGEKGPMEKTGETIDNAGKKTGEVIKEGAEKTGEAAKDAGNAVKDAAK